MSTIAEFLESIEMTGIEIFLAEGSHVDYEDTLDPVDFETLVRAAKALADVQDLVEDLEAIGENEIDSEDEEAEGFESEPE